jgi:branched-chain amino acid transport system permease protein
MQMMLFGQIWIAAEVLRQLLYGLALVLIMLLRPSGLWPSPRHEDQLIPEESAATEPSSAGGKA